MVTAFGATPCSGELVQVSSGGSTLWQPSRFDARGQVTSDTLGSTLIRDNVFEATLGRRIGTRVSVGGNLIQDVALSWDAIGNVLRYEDRRCSIQ